MNLNNYLDYVILPLLSVSMMLTFIRFVRGPRVVDRVIALDLIITIGIAFITVFSIRSGKELFLDVAMILALIAFLGTVAFSYYLEKKT
ncbi:cation:proton antiporter [Leadbetterella sp. DM7]|uniref:cation:proton antiporter n=1 Tax=Leadbetterella sp. DM7 TaxID=3235085 RepID=UPI00349F004C